MFYIDDVVDYFENLCAQHPDLSHDAASGQRVFEVVAYEDAFSDFRTAGQPKTFFVRFILPTMRLDWVSGNGRKMYQAGLMVGRYYSRREDGRSDIMTAWGDAERVADDFVARMVADSANGYALFHHTIDTVANMDLAGDFWEAQGDGSFVAVLYMFNFGTFRCLSPTGSEYADWADGGLST